MRVLVFGSRGWLGTRFAEFFETRGEQVIRAIGDVAHLDTVRAAVQGSAPDLIVNAASRTHSATRPNIDGCVESDSSKRATVASNAMGAGNVAIAAAERGCRLVHLASGCIFDGDGVFDEASEPNPVSWYAETKAVGDRLVLMASPDALVLRIRMPISARPHPRNLLTKLAGATRVIDVVNSVTVVEDLLEFTADLVRAEVSGIVHAVHPTPIAFRTLMGWYRSIVDPAYACAWVSPLEYETVDGRSNCVLRSRRDLPVALPDTELAVTRALHGYAAARVAA